MSGQAVFPAAPAGESRAAALTSEWLINYIREHGGVMTVVRDVVVD
jgi:hypothetical protein